VPIPGNPPTNPVPPGPNTVGQVITNALYELNIVAPGEIPDPLEMAFALSKYNQLADSWNTRQYYIFASDLVSFNPPAPVGSGAAFLLVPNLSPHTIGPAPLPGAPAPTFQVINERPVRIVSANIIQNNVNPIVKFPIMPRDKDWYSKQRVPTIQTTLPTDFYYRPSWPLGAIFFWPVPNYAYGVEFEIEEIIQGGVNYAQAFAAPPGYELALTLTLAELLAGPFERPMPQGLPGAALQARQAVQALNAMPPRINLDDFGPSSTEKPRASFNYYTGLSR
jgi:hypothetical protein